jgi:hypothetical protein
MSDETRDLRRRLIGEDRRRGELLHQARQHGETLMLELAAKHDITPEEAYACLALYERWEQFVQAELWAFSRDEATPSNCSDALALVTRWQQRGRNGEQQY